MVKGGLRLKREIVQQPAQRPTGPFTVADIWVDSGVYHLDSTFSYLIPGNLAEKVCVGSAVSIPFHGREVLGTVIALSAPANISGLKSISKVVGEFPLLTPSGIELLREVAQRYAAHPYDLIRSAIPDRMATIEKRFQLSSELISNKKGAAKRLYLQLPPAQSRSSLVATKIMQLSAAGGVLALLPDTREVSALSAELNALGVTHTVLDSQLPKSEYFENFLLARTGAVSVVIGTRSAIYAPVQSLTSIIIFNEGSENFYERRSPGWNVRDVALLRSRLEKVDLYFVGYSPSSEVSHHIEANWIDFKRSRGKLRVATYSQSQGELLPSRALNPIKSALKDGPVLFLVPLKGYAQAIRCRKCRTISRCECGGAHEKISLTAPISCNHCGHVVTQWKCQWCNTVEPSISSRGIERHQFELGHLFPGIPIALSTADHHLSGEVESGIVISTPGMAPRHSAGYSAVVILEGNRFLNQPDMRSSERVRDLYFAHAALARSGAPVILIQDEGDPISTALATWNPLTIVQRELEERKNLSLPPYVRSARITMESSEVTRFKSALMQAMEDGRIPASTKLLGPIAEGDKASLILTAPLEDSEELIATIHEFMRRRSAAKKSMPSLRIDPYSLSR